MQIKRDDKIRYKHITALTLIIAILLLVSLSTVSAANQTIDDNTTGGINQGVTDTEIGGTLTLNPGTYNKTNQDTNISISKNITLKGNGSANNVIIDAQGLSRIFTIGDSYNVTFINLTFTNAGGGNGSAIYNNFANTMMTFINCSFTNNIATDGAIYTVGDLNVIKSNFINCRSTRNGGGIYIHTGTANVNISESNFINNSAYNGGGIYNRGGAKLTVSGSNFINNTVTNIGGGISNTGFNTTIIGSNFTNNNADFGGGIYNNAANLTIIGSYFANNNATNGGGLRNAGVANLTVIGSIFINNTGTTGGAINNNGLNPNISGSIFINNIATNGGAIFNMANNGSIFNSSFDNNSAINGSAIYNDFCENLKIISSNFTNNKMGAAFTIYGINTTITGCNIINNSQGILIFANNSNINYNRIFNNTNVTGFDLDNNGVDTNADLNWWGSNNPLVNGISLGNYFVINITNLTSTVTSGIGEFNYSFGLNTNDPFDVTLLPYFVTNVYTNITNGIQQTFDARFDRTVTVDTDKGGQNVTYTFVTDNNVKNISLFVEPTSTNLEVNNTKGKNGETVELIAKLTDQNGNPIAGKEIIFHVANKIFTTITDANGIARVHYTIDADDFTDGKLTFTATFAGDENYLTSTAPGIITLIEEPIPSEPPEISVPTLENETTKNPAVTSATMKKTGMPINMVLLALLSILGVLIGRKQK